MKKYLLTAALAVVVSGTFVSCHDDEITPMTIDQKKLAFEEAFVRFYGQPDPNHTWGFGENVTRALTRGSINVNGNMWDTCPTVDTPDEVNAIFNYVNYTLDQMDNEVHHRYSTTAPGNIDGYFVTQVRNGKNTDNNYINTYNNNAAVNGVGGYMNHLQIAFNANPSLDDLNNSAQNDPWSASGWNHINNFNASDNANYGGNTKVENAGAYDFAYHNSLDSKYHNTWILIDGADITSDGKYKDYLYVCFDFESTPQCTTRFRFNYNGQEYGPIDAAGAWKVADAIDSHLKVNLNGTEVDLATVSNLRIDNIINGDKWVPGDTKYTDWIVRITKGQPKQIPQIKIATSTGKTLKEVYTISKAVKGGRVMCEDLASNSYDRKDFDYNDVVFDAIIYHKTNVLVTKTYNSDNELISEETTEGYTQEDGMPDPNYSKYYANIRLMAAGGTIPAQIIANGHNFEVHNLLGGKSTTVMINTLHENERAVVNGAVVDSHDPVDLTVDGSENIEDIEDVSDIDISVKYSWASATLEAKYGEPTAKIMVPLGTRWAKERTEISEAYPGFSSWVQSESGAGNIWNASNIDTGAMYDDLEGLTLPEDLDEPVSWEKIWNDQNSTGSETGFTDATNRTMATPGSNETILYNYASKGYGYLFETSDPNDGLAKVLTTDAGFSNITSGSIIRVYGVSISDWQIFSTFNPTNAITTYTGDGYVDIEVTNSLSNDFTVWGKNFTITYITVVGTTPASKPGQFWPSNGGNGDARQYFEIASSDVFKTAAASQKLCIYCTIGNSSWLKLNKAGWGQWTLTDLDSKWRIVGDNKELEPVNGLSSVYNQTKGCVEVQLSTGLINEIKASGLGLNFGNDNMTITNITIE